MDKAKALGETETSETTKEKEPTTTTTTENSLKDKPTDDVIPITSYTSHYDDDDDDEDDDDEDESSRKSKKEEKQEKGDAKKLTTTSEKTGSKKSSLRQTDDSESETDEKAEQTKFYANVLSKLNNKLSKPTSSANSNNGGNSSASSKLNSPVKKTPIIKAGQTAKERGETKLQFIGPKLPLGSGAASKVQQQALISATSVSETGGDSGGIAVTGEEGEEKSALDEKIQKEMNYSKDELAKYDHLLKMSQQYAKYNQVRSFFIIELLRSI